MRQAVRLQVNGGRFGAGLTSGFRSHHLVGTSIGALAPSAVIGFDMGDAWLDASRDGSCEDSASDPPAILAELPAKQSAGWTKLGQS